MFIVTEYAALMLDNKKKEPSTNKSDSPWRIRVSIPVPLTC